MTVLLAVLALLAGLALLTKGADWLVDGAVALARRWRISDLVIGLTVVAFGTSAPELVVSCFAAAANNGPIALGNVAGSNIFNILFILGLTAVIKPLATPLRVVRVEMPLGLLAAVAVAIMVNHRFLDRAPTAVLGRGDALILLLFFGLFMYTLLHAARQEPDADTVAAGSLGLGKALLLLGVGLAGLVVGARATVYGAVTVAQALGIGEAVIAVTVIAAGTSLPELATSLVAARKGNASIAIGNVAGSNIFNLFAILGIAGLVRPLAVYPGLNIDLAVVILASALLPLFMFTGQGRHVLDRREGAVFLAIYAGHLAYLVCR
jgi:cation:H+ antiporter